MALPDRKYFYVKEVAKRWSVKKRDVYYYIENDLLEVSTWLKNVPVDAGYYEEETHGLSFPAIEETKLINGLYPLRPDDSRVLFRKGKVIIRFIKPCAEFEYCRIHNDNGLEITLDDVVIAKEECLRFEKEHNLSSPEDLPHLFTPAALPIKNNDTTNDNKIMRLVNDAKSKSIDCQCKYPIIFAQDTKNKKILFPENIKLDNSNYHVVARLLPPFRKAKEAFLDKGGHEYISTRHIAKTLKIEDESVYQIIKRLRKELHKQFKSKTGCDIDHNSFIENKQGQGYRLNPCVYEVGIEQILTLTD